MFLATSIHITFKPNLPAQFHPNSLFVLLSVDYSQVYLILREALLWVNQPLHGIAKWSIVGSIKPGHQCVSLGHHNVLSENARVLLLVLGDNVVDLDVRIVVHVIADRKLRTARFLLLRCHLVRGWWL